MLASKVFMDEACVNLKEERETERLHFTLGLMCKLGSKRCKSVSLLCHKLPAQIVATAEKIFWMQSDGYETQSWRMYFTSTAFVRLSFERETLCRLLQYLFFSIFLSVVCEGKDCPFEETFLTSFYLSSLIWYMVSSLGLCIQSELVITPLTMLHD